MSDPNNPRAFPSSAIDDTFGGMTLRDWFAGQALAGLLASKVYHNAGEGFGTFIADQAGIIADAMIAERAKVQP